jgi:SAM-dependent methyltransferase
VKLCSECGCGFADAGWACPGCGHAPASIDGFPAFAPDLARDGGAGFRSEYFAGLASLEARNFWFTARNRLIVWALQRHFPDARRLLEIGCGTGFVLSGIAAALPGLELSASEIHSSGLRFAAQRVHRSSFFQMDARHIPFEREFDVIGAFDVLEHIREDEAVLAAIYRALSAGGGVILTVPQHPMLWSRQDELACHVRRYTATGLRAKVERAGFAVRRTSSFVSLLLPLLAIARQRKRSPSRAFDPLDELRIGGAANALLGGVMALERGLIRLGVSFPAGGSLLMIATKPGR